MCLREDKGRERSRVFGVDEAVVGNEGIGMLGKGEGEDAVGAEDSVRTGEARVTLRERAKSAVIDEGERTGGTHVERPPTELSVVRMNRHRTHRTHRRRRRKSERRSTSKSRRRQCRSRNACVRRKERRPCEGRARGRRGR